jgi:integrase
VVAAGTDETTGRRVSINETLRAPNNRAGAKLADARLAELIVAVESGQEVRPKTRSDALTVAELAGRWQRAHRPEHTKTGWVGKWGPGTAVNVDADLKRNLLPYVGGHLANRLTALHLDDLYARLRDERGLSPASVSRIHRQVRAMFNWGLRKKLVQSNPALAADPPTTRPPALRIPTVDEVQRVQDAAAKACPDFVTFINLAASTGARRGTLVALRWGDVDLDAGRITFARSISASANGAVEKGTKADRAYVVSIGAETKHVLIEHRQRAIARALLLGVSFGEHSRFFSDDGGVTPWSLGWCTHGWLSFARRAGVNGVRLHDLRHFAASTMLMSSIPISIVAERLGCTEGNVLKTYRHFIIGADREAADLMDRLLTPTTQPHIVG